MHSSGLSGCLACYDYVTMAFETSGFLKRAKEEIHGPSPDTSAGKSLTEFFDNEEESKQFALYLESVAKGTRGKNSPVKAWERYLFSEPERADAEMVQQHFDQYQERKARFEKVYASISKFNDEMLQNSPLFKHFRDFNGAQNIKVAMEEGLRDIALTDPAAFDPIEQEMQKLEAQETEEARFTTKLKSFVDTNGIEDEGKMRAALLINSYTQRQEAITQLLRDQMGFWSGLKDKWTGESKRKAQDLAPENLQNLIHQGTTVRRQAGEYFRTLMMDNKELRVALARMHNDEELAFKHGPETKMPLQEAREKVKQFDKESVLRRAQEFRRKTAGANWGDQTVRTQLTEAFSGEEEILRNSFKKTGFFSRIFMAMSKFFNPEGDPEIENILK